MFEDSPAVGLVVLAAMSTGAAAPLRPAWGSVGGEITLPGDRLAREEEPERSLEISGSDLVAEETL